MTLEWKIVSPVRDESQQGYWIERDAIHDVWYCGKGDEPNVEWFNYELTARRGQTSVSGTCGWSFAEVDIAGHDGGDGRNDVG